MPLFLLGDRKPVAVVSVEIYLFHSPRFLCRCSHYFCHEIKGNMKNLVSEMRAKAGQRRKRQHLRQDVNKSVSATETPQKQKQSRTHRNATSAQKPSDKNRSSARRNERTRNDPNSRPSHGTARAPHPSPPRMFPRSTLDLTQSFLRCPLRHICRSKPRASVHCCCPNSRLQSVFCFGPFAPQLLF